MRKREREEETKRTGGKYESKEMKQGGKQENM